MRAGFDLQHAFRSYIHAHFLDHDVYQILALFLGGALPGFAQVELRARRPIDG